MRAWGWLGLGASCLVALGVLGCACDGGDPPGIDDRRGIAFVNGNADPAQFAGMAIDAPPEVIESATDGTFTVIFVRDGQRHELRYVIESSADFD